MGIENRWDKDRTRREATSEIKQRHHDSQDEEQRRRRTMRKGQGSGSSNNRNNMNRETSLDGSLLANQMAAHDSETPDVSRFCNTQVMVEYSRRRSARIPYHARSTCISASDNCFPGRRNCITHKGDGCFALFPLSAGVIKDSRYEVVIIQLHAAVAGRG